MKPGSERDSHNYDFRNDGLCVWCMRVKCHRLMDLVRVAPKRFNHFRLAFDHVGNVARIILISNRTRKRVAIEDPYQYHRIERCNSILLFYFVINSERNWYTRRRVTNNRNFLAMKVDLIMRRSICAYAYPHIHVAKVINDNGSEVYSQ